MPMAHFFLYRFTCKSFSRFCSDRNVVSGRRFQFFLSISCKCFELLMSHSGTWRNGTQRSGLWGSVLGSVFCSRTHSCYTQRDWLNNQSIFIQNEMEYSVFLKVSCPIIFCFECKHFWGKGRACTWISAASTRMDFMFSTFPL